MNRFRQSLPFALLSLLLASISLGCGAGSGGPETFPLTGTVTYQNKPVPAGRIDLLPDPSQGNAGPAGYAEIKDGAYDTSRSGRGTVGGAYVAVITGSSSAETPQVLGDEELLSQSQPSSELFRDVRISINLPKEASKQDFQIPVQAAANR
ncbi:hypothetical protein M4951_16250 [Blastopirellula sp. J2-11]|uniref:hypothetical protein n=1 Tax=Blastopirellula sp. J2-11 TaxID=2943192 RepID=UPI0021C802C0|nr:hypothetical protein [Blastopirellula sp. J2-11]UUO04932.1 hypothetical protein M4951_16250 [Blastopirellula sp. J2-11]